MTRPSATTLRLHATLVLGLALCGVASWVEWRRALGGHELAWAYSVEWPLFAVVGTYIWWRLLHAERAEADGLAVTGPGPGRRSDDQPPEDAVQDDPELAAWQDYLTRLHAVDPPGGPPPR